VNLPTASEVTGPVRRWRWRLDRRVDIALLACIVAAVIGTTGYLLARFDGVDALQGEAIQRQAFRTSFDLARADAALHARQAGQRAGERAGQRAGEHQGSRLGERAGLAAVERAQAAIAKRQEAKAAAAAARRKSNAAAEATPTTQEPASTPAPATTPTPAPAAEPAAPAAHSSNNTCYDAAGRPC
jgi:type VI protein secretion system component VasK